jgi:hypothetical protein
MRFGLPRFLWLFLLSPSPAGQAKNRLAFRKECSRLRHWLFPTPSRAPIFRGSGFKASTLFWVSYFSFPKGAMRLKALENTRRRVRRKKATAPRRPRRKRWEKPSSAAREKAWKGSLEEEEALRRDPFRSFTCIDPSSKRGVTHPKVFGPRSIARAAPNKAHNVRGGPLRG